MTEEVKKEYQSNIKEETSSDIIFDKKEQKSLETKVGQIEVSLDILKENFARERTLKLWTVGTVVAIVAGIVGGITFYHNITKDYLNSISSTEDRYYQELIKRSATSIKIESCSYVSDYYWQFKNCLNK